jgi:hypothetical protein
MRHDLESLRKLLERIADAHELDLSSQSAISDLAYFFRDCRLEVLRTSAASFTEDQLHRLQQMDYRLQMAASGQGSAEGISPEAGRALLAFGWQPPTAAE